jgi:hypothetical protein
MAGATISSLGNIYTPKVSEAQFKSWMASIEERVRTLETQQRLFNASVKGGAIVAYDNNLNQISRLGVGSYGTNSGTVTRNVLSVTNSAHQFMLLIDNSTGWVYPVMSVNFTKEDNFSVNSTSPMSAWKSTITLFSMVLIVIVVVFPDSGFTGGIWLELGQGGPTTNHAVVNNPAGQTITFQWNLASLGVNPGTVHALRIWGQRTAGSGQMAIVTPDGCRFDTIDNVPTANVNGNV